MKIPIKGMKIKPYGEDYMFPAWFSCVMAAYEDDEIREQFTKETNTNIKLVIQAVGLNAMVDKTTGFQEEAIIEWCDWVTKNVWGEENES